MTEVVYYSEIGDCPLLFHLLGAEGTVEFKKGALCCIEVDALPPRRKGTLRFHLPPAVLRGLGKAR